MKEVALLISVICLFSIFAAEADVNNNIQANIAVTAKFYQAVNLVPLLRPVKDWSFVQL